MVYGRPYADGLGDHMASDLRGHFLGIVSRRLGRRADRRRRVTLSGNSKGGAWEMSATTDAKGMFSADMPLVLNGPIDIRTELKTTEIDAGPVRLQIDSAALRIPLDAARKPGRTW